jgi:DNA ligase-1
MPRDLIESVKPIPQPPTKEKGKRVVKPKVEPDPAREEVEIRCMDAVRRVRKVYVRHPNYGDLAQGLDKSGLEGLEERVQVSVGMSTLVPWSVRQVLMNRDTAITDVRIHH